MLTERAPPWYRDDLLVKTTNDETEDTKLNSYFSFNRIFPKQPLQLWPSFARKEYSFTGTVWNGNNILNLDLSGSYPLNYNFRIQTDEIPLVAPIDIVSRGETLRLKEDLPIDSIIDIDTGRTIRIDNIEVFSVNDQIQLSNETLIKFGKTDSNHSLKQEFVPEKPGLTGIEIMFGETVGNPTDTVVVSICENGDKLSSKTIKPEEIRRNRGSPLCFGFDLNLIPGKTYEILLERTGDININNYYNVYGSASLYPDGELYYYNDGWATLDLSLYFTTQSPPITVLRNLGSHEDKIAYSQTITQENYFTELEYFFDDPVGTPTDNLIFKLIQNGEILENHEVLSSEAQDILVISLTSQYPPGDYDIELSVKNNEFDSENFYTLLTFEDIYPISYPDTDQIALYCPNAPSDFMLEANGITFSGNTTGVELEAIYIKAFAQGIYPLKSVKLYIERENSPDLIEEALFQKTLHQRCFFAEILKENIEVPIPKLPFKMYAKVNYWGLQEEKIVGFPVNFDEENPIYQPNFLIDDIGKGYGLFRREFKENLPYYDYAYTYPIGYPWETEQDAWYEKRISDEYATRKDKNDQVFLYEKYQVDIPHFPVLELKTKAPDIHTIRIEVGRIGLDCEICPDEIIQTITFADTNIEGVTVSRETFTYSGDVIALMDDINFNSELVEATYLNSTHEPLEVGTYFLNTEGTYQNYGLIKSEINQYLGVIPKIKDMADYCLIWDEKEWDQYVWAGDKWDAGVFELQIPIHKIPKNFKLLSIEELQQILSRCKAFGTSPLPMYSHEILLKTSFRTDFLYSENIVELPPLEFEAVQADMYASLFAEFGVEYGGVEGNQNASFDLGFSLEVETARLIDQAMSLLQGTGTSVSIDSDSIDIDQSNPYQEGFPHGVWGGGWNDVMNMLTYADGYNAWCFNEETELEGTDLFSEYIHFHTLNFNIPLDAEITGVAAAINVQNTTGDTTHEMVLEGVGSNDNQKKWFWGGSTWGQHWFGWNGDLWGRSDLTPAIINRTDFGFKFRGWIRRQRKLTINRFYAAVWYKYRSGNYVTTRIVTPELPAGYDVGHWDTIQCEETKPSGTTILYDVFEDIIDRQQTTSSHNHPFGQGLYTEVYQTFVPTTSWYSGVWVKAGNPAKVGTPSGDVVICIREPNGTLLAQRTIPKAEWTNSAEIFVPLNLNLTVGQTYWITWWATSFDNNNYFQMAYKNQAIYGKMGVYESGVGWRYVNNGAANAWFKTTRGNNLLVDKTNPIDISSLSFQNLRLKAKLSTSTSGITPVISEILAKAKVINL